MESIANYNILKTLSDKGAARVYLARHKKLGRKTLLKVYSGVDADMVRRFEREARIVADLNSEWVVAIYDFGEFDGLYYISMEYVEGENLQEYLKQHRPGANEILEFTYQIVRCLAVIHEKGYIHRDLKPENILVKENGQIKITDFGITLHESFGRMTHEGGLVGSPLYMSPEQVNNAPLTPASDLFSLGTILYQLATGANPFEAERYGEIFSRILGYDPPLLPGGEDSLPDWFCSLVERLLSKDPSKRPATAMEVLAEMKQWRTKNSGIETGPPPANSGKTKKKGVQPFIWAILVSIIIIFPLLLFWRKDAPEKPAADDSISISGTALLPAGPDSSGKNTQKNDSVVSAAAKEPPPSVSYSADNQKTPLPMSPKNQPDTSTTLVVKTNPWCRVYLNYELFDVTPMTRPLRVKAGKYLLSLQSKLYPAWSDSVTVSPNRSNSFEYNLDSLFFRLSLEVVPWGEVYVDGKHIGTTPMSAPLYLRRKDHVILIKNDYYEVWEDTLKWVGQKDITQKIVLRELPVSNAP